MKSGYDLSRLIKFTLREDWRDALEDAMAEHVGLAQEEFGVEFEEIGDILGDHYEGLLFGCALEDLMTRRFEPDGINLVDDYLKRRGWNESAPPKPICARCVIPCAAFTRSAMSSRGILPCPRSGAGR